MNSKLRMAYLSQSSQQRFDGMDFLLENAALMQTSQVQFALLLL